MALSRAFVFIVIIAVVGIGAWAWWPREAPQGGLRTISAGNVSFAVETLDTPTAREKGLSGRASLPEGRGLLFVFESPGSWGIWMKDMNFPIDIIWAREDGTIITIARSVSPDTYPTVFYPTSPDALYVLEVNAGAAAAVAEGNKLVVE